MNNSGLPLYLKISPIYNKILQLGIAVLCIVVLLNTLIFSQNKQEKIIVEQFHQLSEIQLNQAVTALKVLFNNEDTLNSKNEAAISEYIHNLANLDMIKDVHFYDESGLLKQSSTDSIDIKTLYGLMPSDNTSDDQSLLYGTFVKEVRTDKLLGYLRFTVNKNAMTDHLSTANFEIHEMMRVLILFSIVIGFLLTRGFSRFSRQGFRVSK